jgi:hypothetical protein
MEGLSDWSNVIIFLGVTDQLGSMVLKPLELCEETLRQPIQHYITVIQFGDDKSMDNALCCLDC